MTTYAAIVCRMCNYPQSVLICLGTPTYIITQYFTRVSHLHSCHYVKCTNICFVPTEIALTQRDHQSLMEDHNSGNTAYGTAQHITAQHITSHHSTAHHITAQHSTSHHSTAQHITAQHNHSTAQHSTAQHITTQHNTAVTQCSRTNDKCRYIHV